MPNLNYNIKHIIYIKILQKYDKKKLSRDRERRAIAYKTRDIQILSEWI